MYVELPEGVYSPEYRKTHVGLLDLALEGSKQGSNIFRKGNKAALIKCGARMLDAEPTWFIIDIQPQLQQDEKLCVNQDWNKCLSHLMSKKRASMVPTSAPAPSSSIS